MESAGLGRGASAGAGPGGPARPPTAARPSPPRAPLGASPVLLAMLLPACATPPLTNIQEDPADETTAADDTRGESESTDDGTTGRDPDATGSSDGESTAAASSTTEAATTCGDGVLDDDEACDDGNAADDDACLSTCVPAACGDGFIHVGHEGCDDANDVDTDDCTNACTLARCGDGIVSSAEACDDANDIDTDECTDACTLAACGDGILHGDELCDDGGETTTCDADCTPSLCGDHVVNAAAGEACDDGAASAACDADCTLAECGDGQLSPLAGEACDDGNTSDTDACSSTCQKLRRTLFVSSALYTGNLGGLAGADAKCQALALSAGLAGKYYAWLSAGVTSPGSRFLRSAVPYVLPNGTQVAKNWNDLADGTLQHAIDLTEKNTAAPIPAGGCGGGTKPIVWTNTSETAAAWNTSGCNAWTGTSDVGRLGHAKATNFAWTRFCEGQANSCSWQAALYCVEQ